MTFDKELLNEPTKREFEVLRTLSGGLVESRGGLHPAGAKTIADMLSKDWIEEVPAGAVGRQMGYRITSNGHEVYAVGRVPTIGRAVRLKTLRTSLASLPPLLGSFHDEKKPK